ncbi:MAG: hypothetical protein ACI85O_001913 [Saprospiraceae bacterium]|jgi:uncharacterized protein YbbC (DUF1343 family)
MLTIRLSVILISTFFFACNSNNLPESPKVETIQQAHKPQAVESLQTGAQQTAQYFPLLQGKSLALVVNQTSTIKEMHLVDTLVQSGIKVSKIFAPEHGFRGTADAGERVKNGKDDKTGIPLISLYGKHKKPFPEDLENIDMVVFDIQDVGARFYTYISTMSYVMEACAEQDIPVLILDRPNPNGHFVDGPILEEKYSSFVGLHPVPIVHGMTVGEYAQMVNGEKWLKNGIQCEITVIPCAAYDHEEFYELPIKPSPNLPNMRSIYLYPSLCFFEGTTVNAGRGTNKQFQVFGDPKSTTGNYNYTPISMAGAKYPKHEDKSCNGYDLSNLKLIYLQKQSKLNLSYLMDFYQNFSDKESFFLANNFFDNLTGTDKLRNAIIAGKTEAEIRTSWDAGLEKYREMREEYLLYR